MKGKERHGRAIDWSEVRRRMEAAAAALERREDEAARNLRLRQRAMALAAEPEDAGDGALIDAVEFSLARESYAIENEFVREICHLTELTPVPCTPAFVLGIINVRGRILSVIDIKKIFGMPDGGLTDQNKVIILCSGEMEFGVLADEIKGVRRMDLNALEAALPTLTGVRQEYLRGIAPGRLIVLDAKKLLSDKAIVVHENIES